MGGTNTISSASIRPVHVGSHGAKEVRVCGSSVARGGRKLQKVTRTRRGEAKKKARSHVGRGESFVVPFAQARSSTDGSEQGRIKVDEYRTSGELAKSQKTLKAELGKRKEKEGDSSIRRRAARVQKGFAVGVYLTASSVAVALQYAAPSTRLPGLPSLSQNARAAASSSSSASSIPSDFPAFLKSGGDWTQNRYQDVVSYYSKQVEQLKDKQQLSKEAVGASKAIRKSKSTKSTKSEKKKTEKANARAQPAAAATSSEAGEDLAGRFREGEVVIYKDTRTGQNFKMTVLKVQSRKSGNIYRLESVDGTICFKGVKESDLSLPLLGRTTKAVQQVKQRAFATSATTGAAMKSLAMVLVALCVSCMEQLSVIAQQCTAGVSSLFAKASNYVAEADFTLSDFLSDINDTFFGFLTGIAETITNLFSRLSLPSVAVLSDFFQKTGDSIAAFFSSLSLPSMVVFTDFFRRIGETIKELFGNLSMPEINFEGIDITESLRNFSARLGPIVRSPPFLVSAPCVAILLAMGYFSRMKRSGEKVEGNAEADKAISASLAKAAAASTTSPTEISTIPRPRSLFSTSAESSSSTSETKLKPKPKPEPKLETATQQKVIERTKKKEAASKTVSKSSETSPLEIFGAVASVAAQAVGSAVSKANEGDGVVENARAGLKSFGKSVTSFSNQFDTSMGKGGKKFSQAAVKLIPAIEEKREEEQRQKRKLEEEARLEKERAQMDLARERNVKDVQAWIDNWRKNRPQAVPSPVKESTTASPEIKVESKTFAEALEEPAVAKKPSSSSGSVLSPANADAKVEAEAKEEPKKRSTPFNTEEWKSWLLKLDPVQALRKWIRN